MSEQTVQTQSVSWAHSLYKGLGAYSKWYMLLVLAVLVAVFLGQLHYFATGVALWAMIVISESYLRTVWKREDAVPMPLMVFYASFILTISIANSYNIAADEVMILLATLAGTAGVIYLLGNLLKAIFVRKLHPVVNQKVYEELQAVHGDCQNPEVQEALSELAKPENLALHYEKYKDELVKGLETKVYQLELKQSLLKELEACYLHTPDTGKQAQRIKEKLENANLDDVPGIVFVWEIYMDVHNLNY